MSTVMKQGDFTAIAGDYARYRNGYSDLVRTALCRYVEAFRPTFCMADIGAGTGIWTRELAKEGIAQIMAIEPNDAMREAGIQQTSDLDVRWIAGSAQKTMLPEGSVDWITMASSFHWTDPKRALAEFRRALRPGGHFTCLWNPRVRRGDPLQERIESLIGDVVPEYDRGSRANDQTKTLLSTGDFQDCIFIEAVHTVTISRERYLGAWSAVNDLQSQAGPERFARLMQAFEAEVAHLDEVTYPLVTRAWTVRRVD